MTLLSAAILGVVEGLTEFLPVSSTGHLILASSLLRLPETEFLRTFEIAIQLGAILAVVALYASQFFRRAVLLRLLAAFLPTALIGFFLHDLVKNVLLGSEATVLWALFLGGIFLIVFELTHRENARVDHDALASLTIPQAFGVGVAQAVAIIPGVSRSAASIIGGLLLGVPRRTIVDFSFLLAVPTILAATVLDLTKMQGATSGQEWAALGVGFVISFLVAIVAIRWFLTFIKGHTFVAFGIYRIAVAMVLWVVMWS